MGPAAGAADVSCIRPAEHGRKPLRRLDAEGGRHSPVADDMVKHAGHVRTKLFSAADRRLINSHPATPEGHGSILPALVARPIVKIFDEIAGGGTEKTSLHVIERFQPSIPSAEVEPLGELARRHDFEPMVGGV